MCLTRILTLFLVVTALEVKAKVSPGGKSIGVKQSADALQPYIEVVLIELGVLFLLGILIYRITAKIRRIY